MEPTISASALWERMAAWDEELRGEKPSERPQVTYAPLPLPTPVPPAEPEKCEHIDCSEVFPTPKLRRHHQRFHRVCSEATRGKCTRCQKETDPEILKRGILPPNAEEQEELPTSAGDLLAKRAKGDIIKCPHRGCKQEFFGQKVGGLENHLKAKNLHFINCTQPCPECELRGWVPVGDELRLPCDHAECGLHFVGEKERHLHIARHNPCSNPRNCARCIDDEKKRARLAARQQQQAAQQAAPFPTDPTAIIGDGYGWDQPQEDFEDEPSPDSNNAGPAQPKKKRGSYLCKACGQLKRGHVCPAVVPTGGGGGGDKKKKKQRVGDSAGQTIAHGVVVMHDVAAETPL